MKKKYITPTTRVVALRSQAHLLNYSVGNYEDGGTTKTSNNEDWDEV